MIFLFYALTIFLFPAGAVRAWRRRGARGLWVLTAGTVGVLLVLALFAASERGGNRLVNTYGYSETAARLLQLTSLAWVLPVIASAASVRTAAPRIRSELVYPIAVGTALVTAAAGIVVAMYTMM